MEKQANTIPDAALGELDLIVERVIIMLCVRAMQETISVLMQADLHFRAKARNGLRE